MEKKELKFLFEKYKFFPSKRLGQNFLINKKVIKKIIESSNLNKSDLVLEIGAGPGNLTKEIAKKVKKVIAVEKDEKMVEILKEVLDFSNIKNVEIVKTDILKFLRNNFTFKKNFKILGNIPYYLTSRLLRKIFELEKKPKLILFLVQKELAQRIVALPPKSNLLAISTQFFARPKIIDFVSKNCFWPKPKVDSALLELIPKKNIASASFQEKFFKILKAGFSHPRKQILNNFSKKLNIEKEKIKDWLLKNKISPYQRAETLNLENWLSLAKSFKY